MPMFPFQFASVLPVFWQRMNGEDQPFSVERYGDLLRSQPITDETPGLILKDFHTVLDFLQGQEVSVSGVHQLMQLKFLPDLNQRLSHPTDVQLKRPVQKSYPYIHGLYLVLRMLGIAQIIPQGKTQILEVDETLLQTWNQLNPTEQYFALLEAWLMLADEAVIGEQGGGSLNQPLYKIALFWAGTPDNTLKFPTYKDQNQVQFIPGLHNLALLDLFGLLSIQTGATEAGQSWRIQQVQKLPLGDALIRLTVQTCKDSLTSWESASNQSSSSQIDFGILQPPLQPFFPQWQTVWTLPGQGFQAGTYTFKVSLGKVWRRIAIPADLELDDLAIAILGSYEFDADHLYEFSYKDRRGLECQILHPVCEEPPFTSEVRVGDLSLLPGQAMTFRYDFGDNWKFKVELETITPADSKLNHPTVLERHGKAPEQYRNDGEW
ncbi:MAG: plasmid pRiA4b ORF-3 family protein [Leptolyngbyaceae cyanobacterium]